MTSQEYNLFCCECLLKNTDKESQSDIDKHLLTRMPEKLPKVVTDKQISAKNVPHPPHEHFPCRHMLTRTSTQRVFKPIKSLLDAGLDAAEELKVSFFSEL